MASVAKTFNDPTKLSLFRQQLLDWFDGNKRDLPWRKTHDPYRIWLSEIMLQQTRVAAVTEYYQRFLQRFPTVAHLARAREPSVLAAWSGLGYYRRARMLHAAARKIVKDHGGQFPATADELRALPGVGAYTAAAVASIAFNRPEAVLDGNVERVLTRIAGKRFPRPWLWQAAGRLLDLDRPGDFNQALMELGSVICLPRQPKCSLCPVRNSCVTRGEHTQPKPPKRRKRELYYSLTIRNRRILLTQRPSDTSLMPGMWELPEIVNPNGTRPWRTFRHSITTTDYSVKVFKDVSVPENAGWITLSRASRLPLTGLTRKILHAERII